MMDSAKINIEINQTIFNQLNELQAEFVEIKNSVNVLEKNAVLSFATIKNAIEKISLTAIIEQVNHVADALSELNRPAIEFDEKMAELSAITGIAGKDLEELGRISRQVGRESGLGATQAAEAFKLLASQISVDRIGIEGLIELQRQTIVLAQATGMDLPAAAQAMASAINQFGLSAAEASRVINVLAAGSKYGAAEVPQLADAFEKAGAVAAAAKLSIEELAGAAEVLSQNATIGSEAGTALRNIILRMQTELGYDFSRITLSQALEQLKPKINDVAYLTKVFGIENMAAVQYLIQNAQAVEEMTQKVTGTSVAYEQAEIRTRTYAHQMAVVKAWVDEAKLSFVAMTGPLLPLIEVAANLGKTIAGLIPLFNVLLKLKILLNKQTYITIGHIIKETALWLKHIAIKTILVTWTSLATAAQWALNIAMKANPIGILITAIGVLIGLLGVFREKWRSLVEWLKDTWLGKFIQKTLEPIIHFFEVIWPKIEEKIRKIGEFFENLWKKIKNFFNSIFGISSEVTKANEYEKKAEKLERIRNRSKETGKSTEFADRFTSTRLEPTTNYLTPKVSQITDSYASGSVRHVNVRIENLVRQININVQNIDDLKSNIKTIIEETLISAIRDTELAIS